MQVITLKPTEPITEPVTKFGGLPVWLAEPQWPIGRESGAPMRFICQVRLPDAFGLALRLAYVFMSDYDDEDETWDPEAGANAVILQPGPFDPHVEVRPNREGPTLERMVPGSTGNRLMPVPIEYRAELTDLPDECAGEKEYSLATRVGGSPGWLQSEETPSGGPWRFLAQIDSATEDYSINFGDVGIGYVFVSADGLQARFLWQCC